MESLADAVAPLATARRSGREESLHHGVAVALDADGRRTSVIGDPSMPVYARSSMKPLQAAAMVSHGLDLPPHLLAVVAASHSGEQEHVEAVREILARHGMSSRALANTPALPLGEAANAEARRRGQEPERLTQNCSGKHAGMLATCVVNGWPTAGYLDPEHPVQRAIAKHLADVGAPPVHVGVDGCGAPTHMLRLEELALAIGRLARSSGPTAAVADAMRTHPWMVGGTGRDVTEWMQSVVGLVAKDGAAGVMVLALADGRSAAFKVADGSDIVRRTVTVEALRALGIDVETHDVALRAAAAPVLGHGQPIGTIEPIRWERC